MSGRVIQTILCLLLTVSGVHFISGRTYERKPLTYNGYRLYRVPLETKSTVSFESVVIAIQKLMRLRRSTDAVICLDEVFWPGKDVYIVVAPHIAPEFELKLEEIGLAWSLSSENYKEFIDKDAQQDISVSNEYDWVSYYKLNDTYNFLERLQDSNPGIVHRFEIGRSSEGRRIIGVHVTKPDNTRKSRSTHIYHPIDALNPATSIGLSTMQGFWESLTQTGSRRKVKPTIFIEAGMHGNQWITSAAATYIINELATSDEPAIAMVAKRYNWLILPHANPDGYVYTDKSDRLWSRTRGKYDDCIGVDPNRNFDFNWEEIRPLSRYRMCNKIYRGPNAFSEAETRALSDAILRGKNDIQLYIALNFGERRKAHFSYDYEGFGRAPNTTLLKEINDGIVEHTISDVVSPHGASSVEWAYQVAGIKNVFNFEIGAGTLIAARSIPGTQVPESAILTLAKDTVYHLVILADKVLPKGDLEPNHPNWQ